MIKKAVFSLFSISLFALSACSSDAPEVSEVLRKVGSPIQGTWQIADFDSCKADVQDKAIIITANEIQSSNDPSNAPSILLADMKELKSTKFLMLTGTLNVDNTANSRTLAYSDQGDKLTFQGFIIDDKLLSRKKILEDYNADGQAARNVANLDFNFCSNS